MTQLSIFDQSVIAPRARRRDPETSKAAANKAASFAVSHRNIIAAALDKGNGNIYDLAKRTGIDHVAIARRMIELERLKLAHPTEERREGCRVWAKGPKPDGP